MLSGGTGWDVWLLSFNQGVVGSNPTRLTVDTKFPLIRGDNPTKERMIAENPLKIHRQPFNLAISCQRNEMTTLSDALTAYKICARAEGKSPKTIDWIADAVRHFGEFLGDISLEEIGPNDLRAFIAALQSKEAWSNHRYIKSQNRKLSPESIKSYTRAIKTFFSFLEREQLINVNAMAKIKLPKAPQRIMPNFREKEIGKLFVQPDKNTDIGLRDYTIMLCLLDTGIRVSELCSLKVDDVDLANGYLRVMGKGQKERHPPLGARLTKALMKYKMVHRPGRNCDNYLSYS